MKTRMKIYTALSLILAAWIAFYVHVVMAQSAELDVTVCIVTLENPCACPNSNICEKAEDDPEDLNDLEAAAGVAEWTMEEPVTIEHFE